MREEENNREANLQEIVEGLHSMDIKGKLLQNLKRSDRRMFCAHSTCF